jgi:uncharacterized membrane protein
MLGLLRFLQLLTMALWVGGLAFFAFVLAPTAFGTLPTIHLAGSVVGACLKVFDGVELGCGTVFLAATAALFLRAPHRIRGRYEMEFLLAGVMVLATAYLQWNIIPAMDRDQAQASGDVNALPADNLTRVHFDRLHKGSERIAGTVLLLGLGVLFLMSREQQHFVPS